MLDTTIFDEKTLSEHLELIKQIKGKRIAKLERYSLESPEDISRELKDRFQLSEHKSKSLVFRRTYGPLLLTLDSGMIVGFSSDESQGSVSIWIEKTEDGQSNHELSILDDKEFFPIDAEDSIYSEELIHNLLNQEIKSLKILKNEELNSTMGVAAEVGLLLSFKEEKEIIISHNISDNIDNFALILRNEIDPEIVDQLQEIQI
jgi:hypothetical protein